MEFTAHDVVDITLGLMNDQKANSGGYSEFYLPVLNTVLSECKDAENALRYRDGMEELQDAPYLKSLTEVIPYHAELVRNVLPYGLGMFLFLGDDENVKATFFSSKYDEGKGKYSPAVYVETEDVY
jgi:hypothetical protein